MAILTQNSFEIRDVARPTCGPQEILVKTMGCGICSGDVFAYKTRSDLGDTTLDLGHEISGVVTQVGEAVNDFAVGDLVTAVDGKGAYAEYFVATQDYFAKLPANIDPLFALGEPVACCVHAGNRFRVQPGDRVAVIGCGFMGLVSQQIAKYQGAEYILAVDPVLYRREMALQLGAHSACTPDDYQVADPDVGEFDVVLEATGVQGALDLSGDMVKQHGRIVLLGYHQSNGGMRQVNVQQWNFKAIDVVNGHVRRNEEKLAAMQQGLDLMQAGHIVTEPLVKFYDLDHIEQAFRDLTSGQQELFKVVIVPEEIPQERS